MEADAGGEFLDWELLQNNSSDETNSITSSDSFGNINRGLEGIDGDGDSLGMIRTDYFSLDSPIEFVIEESSVESGIPRWVDPESETRYATKESGEFSPDSGRDGSDNHKFSEFEDKQELGFVENAKNQVGFGGVGVEGEGLRKYWSDSGGTEPISMKLGEFGHNTDMVVGVIAKSAQGSELLAEENVEGCGDATSGENESVVRGPVKPTGEEQKRSVVWWKVPFDFFKLCAFRVSPVWTLSVAAAVMGFVILGRRLNKMRRKSQSLQLKVTMDDKKVSQFMRRATRLNEAFSVPVIRPSLPASGATPWPVMSLR